MVGGWRLVGWRLVGGGRQQEGNSVSAVAAPSMKRQKRLPILKTPGHRAQKPDFVLETPENGDSGSQKSTKTPILCSKCPKTGVPKGKSAQKPQFCAQNARKWGFRKPKKHKNPDFVLGKKGSGSGKRKYWHRKRNRSLPANHRARFQNANTS